MATSVKGKNTWYVNSGAVNCLDTATEQPEEFYVELLHGISQPEPRQSEPRRSNKGKAAIKGPPA